MTIPIGFFVLLLVLAWLGPIAGAVGLSLWVGERGRRRAAENLLIYGEADLSRRQATSRAPREAEGRIGEAGRQISEETVERIAEGLLAQARERGIEDYDLEQAKADARTMAEGGDVEMPVLAG